MKEYTTLQVIWFCALAFFWIGFFVLDGYDFGVGMLVRVLGHDPADRRALLTAIGPWWDGNEVWLIVAGAGTFAAFPQWYATLFSGFYLALFLLLVALILRGVSFEFWGKADDPRWRSTWEWSLTIGSLLIPLLFGVAWANIVRGVPIDANENFTGDLWTLLNPYGLLGGVTLVLLSLAHGAIFLNMRTAGDLPERARAIARWASPAAAVAGLAFLVWTVIDATDRGGALIAVALLAGIAAVLLATAAGSLLVRRPAAAFALSAAAIGAIFLVLFVDLFPHAMVSSTSAANSLTLDEAASPQYTLEVMTWVAVLFLPLVLAYQAWSYWVFAHRVGPGDFARPARGRLAHADPAAGDPTAG